MSSSISWSISVDILTNYGHAEHIFEDCGWDEDSYNKTISSIKDRSHYMLDGYTGKIRLTETITKIEENVTEL